MTMLIALIVSGVWQTGQAGIDMSRKKLRGQVPDDWICSSPFAVVYQLLRDLFKLLAVAVYCAFDIY